MSFDNDESISANLPTNFVGDTLAAFLNGLSSLRFFLNDTIAINQIESSEIRIILFGFSLFRLEIITIERDIEGFGWWVKIPF